ncbi:hypothetical protein DM02DRAFT_198053 [Periconia macrospinosa]|uniref:Uncharacterized protein n=1 Tax=Periconia macrospinosa TaxID=97972 RepID=A0A2V1D869_9PLEO|nr:hypothetical protein DM02DRAFT_198053 [Periconia macrospinosa]
MLIFIVTPHVYSALAATPWTHSTFYIDDRRRQPSFTLFYLTTLAHLLSRSDRTKPPGIGMERRFLIGCVGAFGLFHKAPEFWSTRAITQTCEFLHHETRPGIINLCLAAIGLLVCLRLANNRVAEVAGVSGHLLFKSMEQPQPYRAALVYSDHWRHVNLSSTLESYSAIFDVFCFFFFFLGGRTCWLLLLSP